VLSFGKLVWNRWLERIWRLEWRFLPPVTHGLEVVFLLRSVSLKQLNFMHGLCSWFSCVFLFYLWFIF
jgi:hypothetical protein